MDAEQAMVRTQKRVARAWETLQKILDLAEENTKGIDGYDDIAEWARNAIEYEP